MTANHLRAFWLLFGIYGPTMSMEDIRKEFFPSITLKTLANKASAGQLPKRTGACSTPGTWRTGGMGRGGQLDATKKQA